MSYVGHAACADARPRGQLVRASLDTTQRGLSYARDTRTMTSRPGIPLLLVLALACGRGGAERDAPVPSRATLLGCAALDGHACVRPPPGPAPRCDPARRDADGRFTPVVWVADGTPSDALVVEGDTPASADAVVLDGGVRLELAVPHDARALTLVRDGAVLERWTLHDPPASGSTDDAARDLDARADLRFREADAADVAERGAAWRAALAVTEEAWAAAHARGDLLRARCHVRRGMFVALERLGDPGALERWTSRLDDDAPSGVATAGADAYARGLVAQRLGDLQAAAGLFRAAEAGATRIADRKLSAAASGQLAAVLASLGRDDEITAALERAEAAATALDCRQWLHMLNNTSWSRVVLGEAGGATDDPLPGLADALLVLDGAGDPQDACHDPRLAEHVRLGLALVAAAEGAFGWAEQLREGLPAAPDGDGDATRWHGELDRRIALARGDRGALVEHVVLHAHDADPDPLDAAWSQAWGRGQIYEALGATEEALAAYDAAERTLSTMMLQLEFDAGRDRLLLGRQRSAGRSVALRVAAGDETGALCVARNARARTSRVLDRSARIASLSADRRREWAAAVAEHAQRLRDLDALRSERWSVPVDRRGTHDRRIAALEAEALAASRAAANLLVTGDADTSDVACDRLGAPGDGELGLLYFPVGDDAWMGFAFGDGVVTARLLGALPLTDPKRLAERLLRPFAAQIDAASSLLVLPTGALWTVSFAALPWRDDTLLHAKPIALGLDLARLRTGPAPELRRALVVADPRGNLPAAAREAERVGAALRADAWSVTMLLGDDARAESVRDALTRVELLHYAGHGEHGGLEGWQGALQLADGARLGVNDVLALANVPRLVVLPACDTAPSERTTQGGDMNIARAFLLAGAQTVVAAQGPIDDTLAARIAIALHEAGPLDPSTTPARLRDALLSVGDEPRGGSAARVVALVR